MFTSSRDNDIFISAINGGVGGFIISGGVGCFIFSGGIGSSGFFSVCRFSRDGSGCSLRGKHVAVLSVVSVLAIYAVIDGSSRCNGL